MRKAPPPGNPVRPTCAQKKNPKHDRARALAAGRQRSGRNTGILHAWDVVLKFYEMKGGAEFNSAPARRLSRSFGLDLVSGCLGGCIELFREIGLGVSSAAP